MEPGVHGFLFPSGAGFLASAGWACGVPCTGNPFFTSSSMASSIGTRTVPGGAIFPRVGFQRLFLLFAKFQPVLARIHLQLRPQRQLPRVREGRIGSCLIHVVRRKKAEQSPAHQARDYQHDAQGHQKFKYSARIRVARFVTRRGCGSVVWFIHVRPPAR